MEELSGQLANPEGAVTKETPQGKLFPSTSDCNCGVINQEGEIRGATSSQGGNCQEI